MTIIFDSLIRSILVEDTPYRLTFYHGTDFSNVPSIMKQGLKPFKGEQWSAMNVRTAHSGVVYFTSDFEKAARYAVGSDRSQIPVVLEVTISTPRRFNAMRDDPFDKSDSAWDNDTGGFDENADSESFRDLRHLLDQTASKLLMKNEPRFSNPLENYDELQSLDGVNIYKITADAIAKCTKRLSRNDIMAAVVKMMPPESVSEFVEIRSNGIMKLTSEYWNSREQIFYQKPIPPKAIKFAWVRVDDFEEFPYIERQKSGIKSLPHEAKDNYDTAIHVCNDVVYWNHEDKEVEDYEEEAKVVRAAGYDEAADVIEKMALTDPEGREELNDELRDIADNIQGEDWYKDMVVDYSEWGKVNFTDVGRLMRATDGHPVLPGLREYMAGK